MRIERTKPRDKTSNSQSTTGPVGRASRTAPVGNTSRRAPGWDIYPFTPESVGDHVAFLDAAFDTSETDSVGAISELLKSSQELPSQAQPTLNGRLEPTNYAVPFAHIGQETASDSKLPMRLLRNPDVTPPLLLPEHRDGQFPLATAETLAALSSQVYEPGYAVAHRLRSNPFVTHVCTFDEGGAQAIGLVYDGRPILAFRGTEFSVLGDWFQDVKILLVPIDIDRPELRVHSGFSAYLQFLWPAIEAWRKSLPQRLGGWLLTGHSMGGAMAILAAWRLQESGQEIENVVSFGAPAVGGTEFRSHCESRRLAARVWRVISGPDVVPESAPRGLGYCHLGTEVVLEEDWHGDQTIPAQSFATMQSPGVLLAAAPFSQTSPIVSGAVQVLAPFAFKFVKGVAAHMGRFGYAHSLSRAMAFYAQQALAKTSPQRRTSASNAELVQRHTDLARLWVCGRP